MCWSQSEEIEKNSKQTICGRITTRILFWFILETQKAGWKKISWTLIHARNNSVSIADPSVSGCATLSSGSAPSNPTLFWVVFQTVLQGAQLPGCLFLSLCMRQKSCRCKVTPKSPSGRPHRAGLPAVSLWASTASVACSVGAHCCLSQNQTNSWLVFRAQLVCERCFFKH